MATLATQSITRAALNPSFAAATGGGDAMSCGSSMFLWVKNGGGSPITVTLAIPAAIQALPNIAYTSPVITVTNAQDRVIGPIVAQLFQDPVTGLCTITYSGVTTVTVGAFSLSAP